MGDILTTTNYPEIRAAIDVRLTETDLPDAVIGYNTNLGAAEREVKDKVTAWVTVLAAADDDTQRLKAATIYLTAALLCPTVVRATSLAIQARDMSWSKPTFDASKRAEELRGRAAEEISEIVEPEAVTARRPSMFRTAAGTRGK